MRKINIIHKYSDVAVSSKYPVGTGITGYEEPTPETVTLSVLNASNGQICDISGEFHYYAYMTYKNSTAHMGETPDAPFAVVYSERNVGNESYTFFKPDDPLLVATDFEVIDPKAVVGRGRGVSMIVYTGEGMLPHFKRLLTEDMPYINRANDLLKVLGDAGIRGPVRDFVEAERENIVKLNLNRGLRFRVADKRWFFRPEHNGAIAAADVEMDRRSLNEQDIKTFDSIDSFLKHVFSSISDKKEINSVMSRIRALYRDYLNKEPLWEDRWR